MYTSAAASHRPGFTPAHAIYCKFLMERAAYIPCHVRVPDMPQRISAVALDGRFYSFFRAIPEAQRAIAIATRLGKRDDEIVMTLTRRGYGIWVNEPQAQYAPPAKDPRHSLKPAFGPSPCLILSDASSYTRCSLKVPDLSQVVDGISHNGRYYSVFRQVTGAAEAIAIAAKLAQSGDETLMVTTSGGLILAVRELNAIIAS
ncbi:hypothetical protein [Pseudanabaena sp. FACHB-2040]|uniref:hypothetical protein n=1 Tax=Pseudanabaena sp. FACHB-2040 TaxID=2692859 RepID=UPI001687E8A4|nr:hypothetical protein [Pseudanabaena sp. FACHB-2040]MBD2260088.1 hypothetical protein [Pseudanabaena sp. FACHB-2040]